MKLDNTRPAEWVRAAVDRFAGPLIRYSQGITGDLEQARDVVQETFIRLCAEKPERVESHLAQWLFTVCRNLAIDGQRKRGRMTHLVSWLVSGEDRVGLMGRLGTGLAVVLAMLFCVDLAPTWAKIDVQTLLQKATAGSAYEMMKLAGTTVFKNGPVPNFPDGTRPGGKSLMVNLSCAPLNWDLMAVAASVLVGSIYLRSPWKRVFLTLSLFPLLTVGHGLNVFAVAELWIHGSGDIIGSPFHRYGREIFFLLSLVPFVLVLRWLRRLETRT